MPKKLTTEEFIERAIAVHGHLYDYSKVEYKNTRTKIKIICREHGEFMQVPNNHLNGIGCKKCAIERKAAEQSFTTEEFIERAIAVHGNRYDYSLVEYKGICNKIKIICREHGEFMQVPNNHLNGIGCKKCAIEKNTLKRNLTTEEFIERAIAVHGNRYDYSKVDYKNAETKIIIICPVHGEFEQSPNNHLQHRGCPKCSYIVSKYELEICSFLDKLDINYEQSNRSILNGKELDIVMHSKRIAIEFNGKHWHSNSIISVKHCVTAKEYHQMKTDRALIKGYDLVHIFEEDWLNNKQKELDKLLNTVQSFESNH